ncbi:MAG: diguanylate cyclase [Sulfuriferula sp.]
MNKFWHNPLFRLALTIGLIVILGEAVVMLVLFNLGYVSSLNAAFLDALLLAIIVTLAVNYFILRPMRKQERILRLKERELETLLEHIPDLIWIKNADLRYTRVSHSMEKATGLSASQIVDQTDQFVWADNEVIGCKSDDELAINGRQTLVKEKILSPQEGQTKTYLTTRTPLFDKGGRFSGLIGVAHDVTQRAKYERRKRRSDFHSMFSHVCRDTMNIGAVDEVMVTGLVGVLDISRASIWQWDRENNKLHCLAQHAHDPTLLNANAEAIDGAACPAYIRALEQGKPIIATEAEQGPIFSELIRARLTAIGIRTRLDIPLLDEAWNGVISLEQAGNTPRWSSGEVDFVSTLSDLYVSARIRILGQEMRARSQAIADTTKDGIVVINEKGVIESFNQAAGTIFGYMADEAIGRNVSLLMLSPHRELHDDYLAHYMHTGEKKIIGIGRELEGCRKDGLVFPILLNVSEFRIGTKRGFVGVIRDLAQTKDTEAELSAMTKLATIDALTGIMNRRTIMGRFSNLITLSTRYVRPLCMGIIDIDHFKQINDVYGHHAGDIVLKRFACTVQKGLRDTDSIGRYGGEEFMMLMPETLLDQAELMLQRICSAIAGLKIDVGVAEVQITVSAGVAQYMQSESPDDMFSRVDKALYRAKQSGRNRVVKDIGVNVDD